MARKLVKTSAVYIILTFLPMQLVVKMQTLSKKFAQLFVPVTLNIMTIRGTMPLGNTR